MGIDNTFIDGPVARTPGQTVAGPALTLQFLPTRGDQIAGEGDENVAKQTALWQVLQLVWPGDVIVVD
ncbi:MAG: ribonuclease activity regulator RraA, partial [Chloroflexi bacterium]|nr:ribonuclease activity regulator RraA [Chloroflexota bacterium]